MKIGELREAAKEWQKRLGLSDWFIRVRWAKPGDSPEEGSVANIDWFTHRPNALIVMRRGEGLHTLLHELLHLRLEGHREPRKRYEPGYEKALNVLTDELVGKPELWV